MLIPQVLRVADAKYEADRFGVMLIIALAIHVILIFGISFGGFKVEREDKVIPSLEVTLVNSRSDEAPADADYLAQANQKGGGNIEEKHRPETSFVPLIPVDAVNMVMPTPPTIATPEQKKASAKELMTQKVAEEKISADKEPEEVAKTSEVSVAELITQAKAIASIDAQLGNSLQAFAKMPRHKFITAATKEYKYASYMEGWRQKVEKIGNLNFPEEAKRRNLSGSLILDVAINADGSIKHISVLRSSGYKLLDDAAARIVNLAAPYAAFSQDLLKDTDILHITRTWRFLGNETMTTR